VVCNCAGFSLGSCVARPLQASSTVSNARVEFHRTDTGANQVADDAFCMAIGD